MNSASKIQRKPATKSAPSSKSMIASLHLGLNSVDPKHYQGWSGDLGGCENDARMMEMVAKRWGAVNIQTALTRKATSSFLLSELAKCASSLASGDTLFLTYSGHGGWTPDRNGDEIDGRDETWCLYDRQVLDDELFAAFTKFAEGVTIIVCSDSCHSGTATKAGAVGGGGAPFPPGVRAMPPEVAMRTYMANAAGYDKVSSSLPPQIVSELKAAEGRQASTTAASVVLLSGCQDNQYSMDTGENGLFTSVLMQVYGGGKFGGSYRDLHREIVRRMPPYQTPNLYVYGRTSQNAMHLPAFRSR